MNTKILTRSLLALSMVAMLSGCDENSWNDKLNGFKDAEEEPITQVEAMEYTMTAADYSSVATNSTNKALAGDALAKELAAVGTNRAFSTDIPAETYAPAFLEAKYYALNNGSSVKLTYNQNIGLPEYLSEAAAASLYTVTEDDYMKTVWGSEEDYVDAFAPSKTPSRYLPKILAENVDLGEGKYCVVTYNVSSQEPVFGNVGGGNTPSWEQSSTIADAVVKQSIEIKGVVTAICGQGYMISDKSGSILIYYGKTFDPKSVEIGQQMNIAGTVGVYNTGLQISGTAQDFVCEVVGTQEVTYPSAKTFTQADLEAVAPRTTNATGIYGNVTGTVKVNGTNVNIIVEAGASVMASAYQPTDAQRAALVDGSTVTVTGYMISVSSSRYVNFVVTAVNGTAVANVKGSKAAHRAPAVSVPTTEENVLYVYEDGAWSEASNFVTLTPADYKAMGQQYNNLTNAANYLPKFLAKTYPYAAADDVKNVMYLFYNSTASSTYYLCDQYVYNGSEWVLNNGVETVTNQFVKVNGKWIFDPTVYITLPSGRNQAFSATYYQACVDWVYENICVPMGDTSIKSGKFWVTSYGNNEYYSGASAYQNNVDLRPGSAREQYAAGYEGMSDAEVVATMKKRFINEVLPGALAAVHPDVKPMDGVDLIYQITFAAYNGSTTTYVARFKVTAPGTFEPVDCTWDE